MLAQWIRASPANEKERERIRLDPDLEFRQLAVGHRSPLGIDVRESRYLRSVSDIELFVTLSRPCCARGRPIIVEWERDARHSAGLSLVRPFRGCGSSQISRRSYRGRGADAALRRLRNAIGLEPITPPWPSRTRYRPRARPRPRDSVNNWN
ncbi:hypothetical protein EVAR_27439_1 [Eumeta japonica]|uniref:Uncharacterized protein n=1 Tax=Eumeta variegata TaxID=151549 RepID=A0A4C1VKL1_EUMVA|nr:hypothetical protein EVAR_27439_1 [Eumeta japonica]